MKQLFIILAMFVSTFVYADTNAVEIKKPLLGSWQVENVVYTFTNDSLYVDEIGNEGDEYTYTAKQLDDVIIVTATNCFSDIFKFIINCVTEVKMRITILDNQIEDKDACFSLTKTK